MAELNLTVRLQALNEASRTFEQLRQQSRRLTRTFDSNLSALQSLNRQLNDINAYERQSQTVAQTAQRLEDLRYQMELVNLRMRDPAIAQNQRRMQQLREQTERLQTQSQQLTHTHQRQQMRLSDLSARLTQAGINTQNLSAAQNQLRQSALQASNALEREQAQLERLNARIRVRDERLARAGNLSMTGYLALNQAQRGASLLAEPIRQFTQSEQASMDLTYRA